MHPEVQIDKHLIIQERVEGELVRITLFVEWADGKEYLGLVRVWIGWSKVEGFRVSPPCLVRVWLPHLSCKGTNNQLQLASSYFFISSVIVTIIHHWCGRGICTVVLWVDLVWGICTSVDVLSFLHEKAIREGHGIDTAHPCARHVIMWVDMVRIHGCIIFVVWEDDCASLYMSLLFRTQCGKGVDRWDGSSATHVASGVYYTLLVTLKSALCISKLGVPLSCFTQTGQLL